MKNPIQTPSLWIWLRGQWLGLLVLAALVAFPFISGALIGGGASSGPARYWQGQLITVFIMAVYAMSYDLLMGYTGIMSFGHAAFFGGGAYAMALWLTHAVPAIAGKTPSPAAETALFLAGIALVIGLSILLGLLFSTVSVRVKGPYFAMITLAIAEAIYILSKATDFVKWTGADEGLHGIPVPIWLNPTQFRTRFYFIALIFMVVMYLFLRRAVNSPAGRVFVALRENESRARMIGYNPATYRSMAFALAAVVAGLAGAFFALWNLSVTPSMTSAVTTINALIMTILGGIGTLIGPMLGAGLMQVFSQFFYQWFGARWPLVFGLVFILLVIFLPYGIVGTWQMRKNDIQAGWRRLFQPLRGEAGEKEKL